MRVNYIYLQQLRAARRLAAWCDKHPRTMKAATIAGGVYCAYLVFMYA